MKKKEDARLAILREYDRWAKDHTNDAKKMGGFVFFGYVPHIIPRDTFYCEESWSE